MTVINTMAAIWQPTPTENPARFGAGLLYGRPLTQRAYDALARLTFNTAAPDDYETVMGWAAATYIRTGDEWFYRRAVDLLAECTRGEVTAFLVGTRSTTHRR